MPRGYAMPTSEGRFGFALAQYVHHMGLTSVARVETPL